MTDDTSIPSEHHPNERKRSHAALRTGLYTGELLILTMLGGLVTANRIPQLEHYALERNAIFYTLFVLFMLVPVCRFLNRPQQMLTASVIGWVMFVGAYDLAGFYFHSLFDVLRTPFQALVEGAVVYGVFAGGSWVAGMLFHARRHPILPGRRRAGSETPHSR